jgi:hypothetical protein
MGIRPKILNCLNCTATLFVESGWSSAETWGVATRGAGGHSRARAERPHEFDWLIIVGTG